MFTKEFYQSVESVVLRAGEMIANADPERIGVYQKEGIANFVTEMDLQIQKFLITELKQLLPEASFFGEEDTEGNEKDSDGFCFYIDPIDGTTNFVFGYDHSCVSVGLALDRRMIAGFVCHPYTRRMYRAVRGEGAYLNGRKLSVQERSVSEGIVAFGCARYQEGDTDLLFASVKALYLESLSVRNGGSAALDLCRIASGANVGYLELRLQPYDYAAASLIVEEAGGVISQIDGTPLNMEGPCSVAAGTQTACEEIRRTVRKTMREQKQV